MGGSAVKSYNPKNLKRPSANTTPLVRFQNNRPPIAAKAPALLRSVAEARCEITSESTVFPTSLVASKSVLASLGCIGWKNSDAYLNVYKLGDTVDGSWLRNLGYAIPGLTSVASSVVVDDSRKLVYVTDGSRIKSYRWDDSESEDSGEDRELKAVHTMNCQTGNSPIGLLDRGAKLLRVGRKGLEVWDVDSQPTHGEDGANIIGDEMDADDLDTCREDPEVIELSSGSRPTQTISLSDDFKGEDVDVSAWAPHPWHSSSMICGLDNQYRCMQLDANTGQVSAYWLGHGASITSIATTPEDPSMFLTAAEDGVTRLYDLRQPCPVLALFSTAELVNSSLIAHAGGYPCEL